ncbi:acylneuraminate cytidylyltransferase family protein [Sphingobacterium sp.]|uniref:acylneuraminate cytidylyltransferase family protein n=1 Tax=Sphingobacterium sp. TaxID=341027 RepID=UPI0028B0C5CA|nr:acylneuraminate cytidylyltransferase family protein [Sphingobacterium sp.]
MRGLITICARGGSKGIPGKNIKLINGKALIAYSCEVAVAFAANRDIDIVLSTDSTEIKTVVRSLGYDNIDTSYERPDFLANDTSGKLDVIVDVKTYFERKNDLKYDFIIDLDVTSPLRSVIDLNCAMDLLFKNEAALNIFSVSPANRNPYFNMVEEKEDGFYGLCKTGQFLTRQSAPKVYDMNASFYIFKKAFFDQGYKTVISDRTLICELPHVCFDLDHPIDFEFMSYLLENKKLDFEFNY